MEEMLVCFFILNIALLFFSNNIFQVALGCTACLLAASVEIGSTIYTLLFFGFLYVASYLTVWEDFVTDIMRFGKFNGPTEALLLANGVIAFTGYFGSQMWDTNLVPFIPEAWRHYLAPEYSIKEALVHFGICMAVTTIIQTFEIYFFLSIGFVIFIL